MVTVLNFCSKSGMKFVFIVAALVLAFAFSDGELPLAKMCRLRRKTRDKYVCRGKMISLNAEINVECGNFVCEYHWHILRTTNNIRPQPLPSHPRAVNPHSNTSKAISSLRRGGEKHALVSTWNAVEHQLPAKLFFRKGRQPVSQVT